ncbi:hypothetical protein J5N97_000420 [Dioscorea zingiberensis]|uniref:Uncharacterized protein n=1 Tax=Dioscorea zingiberensis TaxID=325984 RepID=A0A9D5H305_9LILI|nr:hypothetical protein J5N97_000420 [Dioscorea zingiberensis]
MPGDGMGVDARDLEGWRRDGGRRRRFEGLESEITSFVVVLGLKTSSRWKSRVLDRWPKWPKWAYILIQDMVSFIKQIVLPLAMNDLKALSQYTSALELLRLATEKLEAMEESFLSEGDNSSNKSAVEIALNIYYEFAHLRATLLESKLLPMYTAVAAAVYTAQCTAAAAAIFTCFYIVGIGLQEEQSVVQHVINGARIQQN